MEPKQNRSLDDLDADFRTMLERYIQAVNKAFPNITMSVSETRRTTERQKWLFSQNSDTRWLTNCDGVRFKSMHQFGIAADLFIVDKKTGKSIWDARVWRSVYARIKPEAYDLELIPQELVHVQLKGSQKHYHSGTLDAAFIKLHRLKLT